MPNRLSNPWASLARYAQRAPSPHNTQPFRLRVRDATTAEILFLPRRGLPVADPQGRFTWLTAGIFAEILAIAAHAQGWELDAQFDTRPMYPGGDTETPQVVAELRLRPAGAPIPDLDANLILQRRTSRLPYDGTACPPEVIAELAVEAARGGHRFETRSDAAAIAAVVALNEQALFNDLDHTGLRTELTRWLRFGVREEDLTGDGLSARCLGLNAPLLRSFFNQHWFWTLPGIRTAVGAIYRGTMKGIGTIAWLRGPYAGIGDWIAAGRVMIRLWLMLTRHGFSWHPYGSVITSEAARRHMTELLHIPAEAGEEDMVWLLLRLGRSPEPPLSKRLPLESFLLSPG